MRNRSEASCNSLKKKREKKEKIGNENVASRGLDRDRRRGMRTVTCVLPRLSSALLTREVQIVQFKPLARTYRYAFALSVRVEDLPDNG